MFRWTSPSSRLLVPNGAVARSNAGAAGARVGDEVADGMPDANGEGWMGLKSVWEKNTKESKKQKRERRQWEREKRSVGLLLGDAEFEDYYRWFAHRARWTPRDELGERDSWVQDRAVNDRLKLWADMGRLGSGQNFVFSCLRGASKWASEVERSGREADHVRHARLERRARGRGGFARCGPT